MRHILPALAALGSAALPALAADFDIRTTGGSVQLGGELVIQVRDGDKAVPEGAICAVEAPAPYDAHITVTSADCTDFRLQQGFTPILDEDGYALPSVEVPYDIVVSGPDGAEAGRFSGRFLYNNQFSDLRIRIHGVRNPVSPGQSFEAQVLGAGQPIDESLLCRWNTYGPVVFESASDNDCAGTLTARKPDGRDADMDVEIVNLTDMHAVGYATARMLVK